VRQYEHLSKIKEVLGPSLDELVAAGYLAAWSIEPRTLVTDFKICVTHGPKFFRDRGLRSLAEKPEVAEGLLAELSKRGVSEAVARQLLATIPDDQPVEDQIEWGDYLIQTSRSGTFRNPAGFYVYLLRNAVLPPREFESRRTRALATQDRSATRSSALRKLELENEYAEYRLRSVEEARQQIYPGEQLRAKIAELKSEICAQTPEADGWLPVRLEELALQRLNAEIAKRLPMLTLEEFVERQKPQTELFKGPTM